MRDNECNRLRVPIVASSDDALATFWNLLLFSSSVFFQEQAFESSQKYKEGKFIIELVHMVKENGWSWLE